MKKAYYARPISVDGTPQADRDFSLIRAAGFEPYVLNDVDYQRLGMAMFEPAVKSCQALFFRAFPDGTIGAGTYKEITWAAEVNIPVLEIPRQISRRILSVEDTREMLRELGKR